MNIRIYIYITCIHIYIICIYIYIYIWDITNFKQQWHDIWGCNQQAGDIMGSHLSQGWISASERVTFRDCEPVNNQHGFIQMWQIPSGKLTYLRKNTMLLMGKLTISMAIFNDNGGFSIAMFDRAVRMFKSSPVSEWRLLECRPNFPAARPLKIVSWIPGRSDLPGPTTLWTSLPHNINCPPRSERFIVLDLFIFLGGHSSGWYFSTWWLIPRIVSGL